MNGLERHAMAFAILLTAWGVLPPAGASAGKSGHIELYTGFGTTRRVLIHGRALEDEAQPSPQARGTPLGNLVRSVRLLETDELTDRPVTVNCGGRRATSRTDKEGFWQVWLDSGERPFASGELPVQVTVQVSKRTSLEAEGIALVYPDTTARIIVTDFDDTLCETGMRHKLSAAVKTLTSDPSRMKPVAGMNGFLTELARPARDGEPPSPVFYLSGGLVNFYPRIAAFLESNRFPRGVLLLRNFGPGPSNDPLSVSEYKTKRLEMLLGLFPGSRTVLVGDSGEKDPEIYAALRKKHPDRVQAVCIRFLEPEERKSPRLAGMILFPDGAEALRQARLHALVPAKPAEAEGPSEPKNK